MIPIYRAKCLDSDEWVEGYLVKVSDTFYIRKEISLLNVIIDPNTLAIHLPNMIDKNGKKIFAGLSEDGVGGDDVVTCFSGTNGVAIFDGNQFLFSHGNVEVIGIHKGE